LILTNNQLITQFTCPKQKSLSQSELFKKRFKTLIAWKKDDPKKPLLYGT